MGRFVDPCRNHIVGDVTRSHNHHILAHMGSFQYSRISLEQGPTELRISNYTWVTLLRIVPSRAINSKTSLRIFTFFLPFASTLFLD